MRIAILSAIILAACATAGKPVGITATDGGAAFLVECRSSIVNCHQAAANSCTAGYVPIGDNRRAVTMGNAYGTQTINIFELTYRCK